LTIFRAGIFTFEEKINTMQVKNSPMTNGLEISPAEIYAPTCIVKDLPLAMVAGT
jgi:hypothetical protein